MFTKVKRLNFMRIGQPYLTSPAPDDCIVQTCSLLLPQDDIYCYEQVAEAEGKRKMVHVPVYMRVET